MKRFLIFVIIAVVALAVCSCESNDHYGDSIIGGDTYDNVEMGGKDNADAPATDAPATDAPTTDAPKDDKGCGGVIGIGAIVAILGTAVVLKKRD